MSTPAHESDPHVGRPADEPSRAGIPTPGTPSASPLWEHIRSARWFGGKGRSARLAALTALPWMREPGTGLGLRTEIATIAFDDGGVQYYQLLLAYRRPGSAPGALGQLEVADAGLSDVFDATRDPEAMRAWLASFVAGARGEQERTGFIHRPHADTPLDAGLEPRVFGGEQSNTSVMIGDVAMVKLFRRLELGRNLDIEVHEAFSHDEGVDAARLFGWSEAFWPAEGTDLNSTVVAADLAMVVEQLRGARDAWDVALTACRDGRDFTAEAGRLGTALAGVHQALAAHFPTDTVPGAVVADTMRRRLAAARAQAPQLDAWADALDVLFAALEGRDLDVQRVHGDFHLGQVLITDNGPKIIDFEGEPLKTMAERVVPDSPWRDVAGLIRSFDYAAGTVALENPTEAARARSWADACRQAFLSAYETQPSADHEAVCAAYIADKAIYEVVYEVRNRPTWAAIPLAAIADLTDSDPDPNEGTD